MNFDRFDLNLVRVFLAIAQHRNVTAAGMRLGLTQSTISHALMRMRRLCNDPLFVRTPEGMLPTQAASAMIEPLTQALAAMGASIQRASPFDPATETRCFSLLLSDIGQLIYLPLLTERLSHMAPGLEIRVLHLPMDAYRNALISGEADLAVGHLPSLQGGFHQHPLFDDPYVCMLRADHPQVGTAITQKQYLDASHITVEPPGRGPGLVDQALSRIRRKRHIVLTLPHFFAGPLILRRTDFLMTVPQRVRLALHNLDNIRFVPLPFRVKPLNVTLLWHERVHQDSGHRWLRTRFAELFAERR